MSARVRIRSWRPKGTELRVMVLPTEDDRVRDMIDAEIKDSFAVLGRPAAGFAFVVWDDGLGSVVAQKMYRAVFPTIMIPDFVRSRLLGDRISRWTKDELREEEGT